MLAEALPPPPGPSWAEEQLVRTLQQSVEEGNKDRRRLIALFEAHEKSAQRRHAETLKALRAVDAGIEEAVGPGSSLRSFLRGVVKNPIVKQATATSIAMLCTALATYAVFWLTGTAPTPTPMQVAQPLDVVEMPPTEAP